MALLQWKDVPLEKVLEDLGKKAGVGVVVDWKTIEASNIPRDDKITLTARNVTMEQALGMISRVIQGGGTNGAESRLAYFVVGGTVRVTTEEVINKKWKETRLYEIGDLVKTAGAARRGLSEEQAAYAVMNTLAEGVDRESWQTVGGSAWAAAGASAFATVRYYDGLMIVVTSPGNQRKVEAQLAEMRKKGKPRPVLRDEP
jgi:hypothetical protein